MGGGGFQKITLMSGGRGVRKKSEFGGRGGGSCNFQITLHFYSSPPAGQEKRCFDLDGRRQRCRLQNFPMPIDKFYSGRHKGVVVVRTLKRFVIEYLKKFRRLALLALILNFPLGNDCFEICEPILVARSRFPALFAGRM